jgi:hypothetical protein
MLLESHTAAVPPRPDQARGASDAERETYRLVLRVVRLNAGLNLLARVLTMFAAAAAAVLALRYVHVHGDAMVERLLESQPDEGVVIERLIALTLPVLLLLLIIGVAGAAAMTLHSRGLEELQRALDTLSRAQREGEVAVSARGLIYAFEEKLANARKALALLLWLGRTLFIVCLGLFAVAVLQAALNGVDLATVVLGSSSLLGALLGVSVSIPRNVTRQVTRVIQMQSIVTGCDRQISLLESAAFAAIKEPELVFEVQRRMDELVSHAVEQLGQIIEPDRAA